ncbi:hypothetical protein [Deinococcus sp. Leaf326]|uniref:hypothetical protein n=1 Tax=Deinococcus sp. Leaf326 TaxID=1736338 RepID=UPI0006F859D6|nr:hypothetical protein [Deinococcus sp. Leaf326]KQR35151.1 hypothetical protein ASF71_16350 [Deinococcus sp. Leaf326]
MQRFLLLSLVTLLSACGARVTTATPAPAELHLRNASGISLQVEIEETTELMAASLSLRAGEELRFPLKTATCIRISGTAGVHLTPGVSAEVVLTEHGPRAMNFPSC